MKTNRNVLFATIVIFLGVGCIPLLAQLYGYLTVSDPDVKTIRVSKKPLTKNEPLTIGLGKMGEDYLATLSRKVDLGEVAKTPGQAILKHRLGPNAITENHLKQLRTMPIVVLDVSYSQIPQNGLALIGQIKTIESLRLSKTSNVTDAGIKNLSGLRNLRFFSVAEHPDLAGNTLSSLQTHELLYLGLRRCRSITTKSLKSLEKFKTLWAIDLQDMEISKEHLQALKNLPNLRMLALSDCRFKPGAIDVLPEFRVLQQLQLANTNIADADLERIAKIEGLTKIDIDRCQNLTAKGIELFKLRLPRCEFTELELPSNPLEGEGTSQLKIF